MQQVEGPGSSLKDTDEPSGSSQSEPAGSVTLADAKGDTARSSEEAGGAGGETANKFYCYICNITCHNQQVRHSLISESFISVGLTDRGVLERKYYKIEYILKTTQ